MICLVCEKTMEMADPDSTTNPIGGTLDVDFGFGSRFDQMKGWSSAGDGPYPRTCRYDGEEPPMIDKLLSADQLMAYICDDCFEKKLHCFCGFNTKKEITKTQIK